MNNTLQKYFVFIVIKEYSSTQLLKVKVDIFLHLIAKVS